MKLLNAIRPALSLALAVTVICTCRVADGQYPGGTGTTGATDGSGRGTGSAGVQTGGGPDTSQSPNAQPFNIFGPRHDVTTTTTANTSATTNTGSERSKKQTRKVHKKSSKTSKQSQATTSPSPSASPR